MSSIWLFVSELGAAVAFAFLTWKTELDGILKHHSVRPPAFTPPGLPFWMSERVILFSALFITLFVVSLTR